MNRAGLQELRRELGLGDAVGVGLGAVIGAGIFVVTGVAAGSAGPAFLIGLLLAGMAATCNTANSNTASTRKVNLILLSCHVKFLNLSANNSISETSR